MTDWKILNGKHVKIFTKTNSIIYTGFIVSSGADFIQIRDKFEKIIFIPIENIAQVEET